MGQSPLAELLRFESGVDEASIALEPGEPRDGIVGARSEGFLPQTVLLEAFEAILRARSTTLLYARGVLEEGAGSVVFEVPNDQVARPYTRLLEITQQDVELADCDTWLFVDDLSLGYMESSEIPGLVFGRPDLLAGDLGGGHVALGLLDPST